MSSDMTRTSTGFARCALNNGRAGVVRKRSSACKSVQLKSPGGGKSRRRDGKPVVRWDGKPLRRWDGKPAFVKWDAFSDLQWDVVPVSQKHRVGRLTRAEHLTSQTRERSHFFKFVRNASNGAISSGEGNRRPYRWWKARACIEENKINGRRG